MGLQINTNVNALNAYRNLTGTQGSMTTSLERLSSGLRINRAADDAAGLAISEKLRSQVNGLNQAQANAQDGISLIQTAEGALNETHAILQRMRTLAVQSASDTNTDSDRKAIQKEINALVKEIDSTTERTQFNGMNLLDGTFAGKSLQIGANQNQTMDVTIASLSSKGLNLTGRTELEPLEQTATATVAGAGTDIAIGSYTVAANATGGLDLVNGGTVVASSTDGLTFTNAAAGSASLAFGVALSEGDTVDVTASGASLAATSSSASPFGAVTYNGQLGEGDYTIGGAAGALTVTLPTTAVDADGNALSGTVSADGKSIELSNGTSVSFAKELTTGATFSVAAATNAAGEVGTSSIDLSTQKGAVNALKMIDDAIGQISNQRADLGALQNRLTHTINNLGVSAENLAASESRIRDTDMAKEMTNFTRSQILQQAGISMLAQANQSSQGVLKLLG